MPKQAAAPLDIDDETLYAKDDDLLPRRVEYELVRRWKEKNDNRARGKLLESYRRLAVSCAQRASRNGLSFEDLVQEAFIGMMSALERFDPSLGNGFGTFARFHIVNRLQMYALNHAAPLRIFNTASTKTLLAKYSTHRKRIEARTGATLTDEGRDEICAILRVDREQLKRYELAISGTIPLDTGAGNSPDDPTRAIELPSGPVDRDGDAAAVARIARTEVEGILKEALASLGTRERRIVVARYMREPSKTLESLSKSMGISRERVRQIELKAVAHLQSFMKQRGVGGVNDIFSTGVSAD